MSKISVAVIAVLSALAGGLLFSVFHDPKPSTAKVEVVDRYVIAPPTKAAADTELGAALPFGTPLASAPAAATRPTGSDLGRGLLTATNIKAFVVDALKQPEKGGVFYATIAFRLCEDAERLRTNSDAAVRKIVAADTTISHAKLTAINAGLARCANFSDGELEALQAQASALKEKDPLMGMLRDFRLSKAGESRDKALDAILASKNMALMSEAQVVDRLLQRGYKTSDNGVLTATFNGHTFSGEAEMKQLGFASQLAACVEGDYCYFDMMKNGYCWHDGLCYDTPAEFVRAKYFQDDPAGYARALALADEMRSALATGDRSAFK